MRMKNLSNIIFWPIMLPNIYLKVINFREFIGNLLNFKQALNEHIKSIYPNINFTMVYDHKKIQFLDLTVYVENGFFKDKNFF